MRAREFYEDDEDDVPNKEIAQNTVANLRKLVDFIHTDCGPWLEQTNGGAEVVWRGMHGRPSEMIFDNEASGSSHWFAGIRYVPKNRTPKDTPRRVHAMFNEILADMGISANRSNSLFVTSNKNVAGSYGDEVFVIMPIDHFNFAWNTEIADLYSEWNDTRHELTISDDEIPEQQYQRFWEQALEHVVLPDISKRILANLINQKVLQLKVEYHNKDIEELQKIYNEGPIYNNQGKPSQYMSKTALVNAILKDEKHAHTYNSSLNQKANEKAKQALTKVKLTPEQKNKVKARAIMMLKNYNGYDKFMSKDKIRDRLMKHYKDDDLHGAIKSGNEIIIECDSYLMINSNLWEDVLSHIFVDGRSVDDVIGGKHESE